MGLFFEERESTKPFILIRYLMLIVMSLILILGIINDFNFNFMKNIYLLLGIGSIIDGFESFLKKENKRQMLLNFGIAFIWFVVFLI
jgi:disulfide bond formation protein DsbB